MEIDVREKTAYIWITNSDLLDKKICNEIDNIKDYYTKKKYSVVKFHSGSRELIGLTSDLICYNHKCNG